MIGKATPLRGAFRGAAFLPLRPTLLAAALAGVLAACTADAPGGFAITNVTVIDGTGGPPLASATVVVQDARITAVGPDAAVPTGATTIDGAGRFLIPGLFEMHGHLSKLRASSLPLFVANGVTFLRDMGGDHEELLRWQDEIRAGTRTGPDLMLAGPYLEAASNVARMRNTPPEEMVEPVERTRIPVGSPAEADRVIDSLARLPRPPQFLKIRTFQDVETYLAIGRAARRHGLDLAGHAARLHPEQILASGQRDIEHFLYYTPDTLDEAERRAVFRRFAASGIGFVPTLVTFTRSIFLPDSVVAAAMADSLGEVEPRRRHVSRYTLLDWREQVLEREPPSAELMAVFEDHVRNAREMWEEGVPVMAGSDVAVLMIFPGSTLHEELEEFVVRVGMAPGQAIAAATGVPARFLGLADSLGTIAPGQRADFVLLGADPLADIRNTRVIEGVMLRGRWFGRAALDSLLASTLAEPDLRVNDWPRRR